MVAGAAAGASRSPLTVGCRSTIRRPTSSAARGCAPVLPVGRALAACLGWWIAAAAGGTATGGSLRPNVIVILADDLGYGDVACYGQHRGKIPTPRIDALAAQGLRFTDGHSSAAACSPSRYSLLTGRYAWRTRLQGGIVGLWEPPAIAPDRLTVAGLAARAGYHTACVGKWHLGWDWPIAPEDAPLFRGLGGPYPGGAVVTEPTAAHLAAWQRTFTRPIQGGPTARGFAEYFGVDVPNWPPFCFIENDRTRGLPSAVLPPDEIAALRATAQGPALPEWQLDAILPALTERACRVITDQARRRQPFLLYVALTSPHTPLAVTKEWQGRSGLGVAYADFVMQTDAAVGAILDAVEAAGCAHNTLVLFTSDNGCETEVGLDRLRSQGHFPSGPYRGYKRDAWEGGHRVPFIVRWPALVAPGTVCDRTVCSIDLLATLAELLGIDLPPTAGEDSVSLLPLLRGADGPAREALVHQAYSGVLAIRSGRWKLIFGPGSGPPAGTRPQLYDLEADPGETRDLADSQPREVARLRELMERYLAMGRSTPGPAVANDTAVALPGEP